VVDAPYCDLWEEAGEMLRSRGGHAILRYPLSIAVWLRAGIDLRSVRPLDVITEVKAPVLFVHGDADRQVPVTHSERMHEARLKAGVPSELWILPGGEHGFDNYPPEGIFWNRILDFFDRALGGSPPEWDLTSSLSAPRLLASAPAASRFRAARPLRAPLGSDGRIVRIRAASKERDVAGRLRSCPHGEIPALARLRRVRFLPAGLAPLAPFAQ
jgi:acetyl esterase/lipase